MWQAFWILEAAHSIYLEILLSFISLVTRNTYAGTQLCSRSRLRYRHPRLWAVQPVGST